MTRPRARGGHWSRGRSSYCNKGVPANPNVLHGVSRGEVISRDQTATSHRGASVMAHDVIAEDINEEMQVEELENCIFTFFT